ncbi:MAG: prohibitin family protein [Methylobacter tundripaludum]|uniref:Regulator of protease activity HflC (Stomatin/prohibitin superfamily) n=1 Tax=Methylobacter tundripaludum TaxID=173365 RepID=A0A2S6GM32_9GAMM|nr:prohibitin family protein [Methylobacter tundripaludum]MCK9637923.1 prohibitin family protein [Methylobacter tundripaludum]PPK66285.1 regulator of protease activity HflC (stomatin/prohibitin superfamily) [Methylobacter tundripaludum]
MFNKITNWLETHRLEIAIALLLAALLFLSALPMMLISIDSGYKGVLWRRFFGGTEMERSYGEGTTLIFPWDKMTIYDTRQQRETVVFNTISKNGLSVLVEASIRFRPLENYLPELHRYIGPDYINILLIPEMGSHVRNVIGQYEPEELYSVKRTLIEEQIQQSIKNGLGTSNTNESAGHYIFVDEILIRDITLPETVRNSIEQKEQAKQVALAYEFRLLAEEKEKLRKKIEAEGIRDFQSTITDGISQKYLTWQGINATVELAKSNNSKVVVIGSGKSGLPIILGSDYTAGPADKADKSDKADANKQ